MFPVCLLISLSLYPDGDADCRQYLWFQSLTKIHGEFHGKRGLFLSLSLGGIKKYFGEYLLKKHNNQNLNNLLFSLPKYWTKLDLKLRIFKMMTFWFLGSNICSFSEPVVIKCISGNTFRNVGSGFKLFSCLTWVWASFQLGSIFENRGNSFKYPIGLSSVILPDRAND